jgi:hypothetical protein
MPATSAGPHSWGYNRSRVDLVSGSRHHRAPDVDRDAVAREELKQREHLASPVDAKLSFRAQQLPTRIYVVVVRSIGPATSSVSGIGGPNITHIESNR